MEEMNVLKEQVICKLKDKMGDKYIIENLDKKKNNDITYTGICIREENNPVGQVLYLNEYFSEYQTGNLSIAEIVENIINSQRAWEFRM